jgi:hypothetical protein
VEINESLEMDNEIILEGVEDNFNETVEGEPSPIEDEIEEGIETAVLEAYELPVESCIPHTSKDLSPLSIIAKERLEGVEVPGLKELAESMHEQFDHELWGNFFIQMRLDPILKEIEEILGMPVYAFKQEDSSKIEWAIEHQYLYQTSAKHQALLNKIVAGYYAVERCSVVHYG